MGGSKSQTVGYQYFAGLMIAIGNPIEQLLDINPAEKGWIMTPEQKQQLKAGQTSLVIQKGEIFGGDKKEGGWSGIIDIFIGRDNQPESAYLANQISEDVSAYPALSYLVFRGTSNNSLEPSLDRGFYLVSMSGMMKEFMLWVKRIHVKNDNTAQWYDSKSEIGFVEFQGEANDKFEINQHSTAKADSVLKNENSSTYSYLELVDGKIDIQGVDFLYTQYSPYITPFPFSKVDSRFSMSISSHGKVRVTGTALIHGSGYNILFDGDVLSESVSVEINDSLGKSTFNISFDVTFNLNDNQSIAITVSALGYKEEPINARRRIYAGIKPYVHAPENHDDFVLSGDINPIHKIREILTDYTAMGKPESEINDENFRKMADRIYDEGLGISWCIQQKSCKEAIEELGYHIEGGVRINRQTGLYEVILFRDDLLDLDDALHFDESNIKSFQPDIINAEDQINAVNVSFYDRENIKDSSFSLSDIGLFHTIDHENAEDLKFPYFMNRRNAEKVANWKLKQLSTMAWKGTFTTGKYEARKLNKYDVVLLSWKSKNIVNLPVRVMNINLGNGRDNTVTLDFVEVVPYSNINYPSINVDPNPNPILPPQPNSNIVFEMPYFEAVQRMGQTTVDTELANNPEIGYLMAAAIKPQNNSLNALLYTDGGTGVYTNFEEVGVVEYCAACYLDQNISRTDTSFAVKSVKDLSRVKIGTLVQADEELLVYESYDTETKILTVKRGALDTIPKPHLNDAVFYFWDDSSGLDSTSYVEGETVKAQVLTTTPSGIENLDPSNVQSLKIAGRAIRPYPPANVKINGEYFPNEIEDGLVLTWVDRNRLQQTGGAILGYFESGVTLENGVEYFVELYDSDNTLISSTNVGTANSYNVDYSQVTTASCIVKIYSKRDGFFSLQIFEHEVIVSFNPPYNFSGSWSESNQSVDLSWSFDE